MYVKVQVIIMNVFHLIFALFVVFDVLLRKSYQEMYFAFFWPGLHLKLISSLLILKFRSGSVIIVLKCIKTLFIL